MISFRFISLPRKEYKCIVEGVIPFLQKFILKLVLGSHT